MDLNLCNHARRRLSNYRLPRLPTAVVITRFAVRLSVTAIRRVLVGLIPLCLAASTFHRFDRTSFAADTGAVLRLGVEPVMAVRWVRTGRDDGLVCLQCTRLVQWPRRRFLTLPPLVA